MSTNQLRFQDYETNLFKIAKSLNISPYNKQKKAENKFKFKETSCCICTEHFEPSFKPLEPCGHYVHESCIVNSGKQECPLCRVSVKLSDKNIKLLEDKHEQFWREEIDDELEEIWRESVREQSVREQYLRRQYLRRQQYDYECKITVIALLLLYILYIDFMLYLYRTFF